MARPRVTIIGTGFVGASIGLALRAARPELEVVGHDSSSDAVKQAQKSGAIEKAEWNLISACESADVLIIATPAAAVKEVFTVAGPYLQKAQVVTDTSGAKAQVMAWAKELLPEHVPFVGGDPVIGPQTWGAAPSAGLFKGATWCLTPGAHTPDEAVRLMVGLVELVGATAYFADAHEHDGFAGAADQLPAVVAIALLRMVAEKGAPLKVKPDMHRMMSATFQRAATFSSTDPRTYRDLCLMNKESISRWIGELQDQLSEIDAMIQAGDGKTIEDLVGDAYVTRSVVSRPYVDADQASQADNMRQTGSFSFQEMFLGRRLNDKTKQAGKK